MLFKNLRAYRITRQIDLTEENLQQKLADRAFAPCTRVDFSRFGWVAPLGGSEQLCHTVAPFTMIAARRQEKILPSGAVNELLEEKQREFEAAEARPMRRRERTSLKEDIVQSLLPRALTRSALIYAYFDTRKNMLLIDCASNTRAEDFLDMLRATLGELPIVPVACHGDAADIMTRWLVNQPPGSFELNNECELKASRDASNVVRCRNQELDSDEITTHIRAGKRATQLSLTWRSGIQFLLTEDFTIKRLRFDDTVTQEADGEDDPATRFDHEFAVMTLQLDQLLAELIEEFGGIEEHGEEIAPAA